MANIPNPSPSIHELQPAPQLVVFDFHERGYKRPVHVNLLDEDFQLRHQVSSKQRIWDALELSQYLVALSCTGTEEFTKMEQFVPGTVTKNHIRVHRNKISARLRGISHDFEDLLEFQVINNRTAIRPTRPFSVSYTLRSEEVLRYYC